MGLGALPWTTVELADALDVPVVGLDVEVDVVERARALARPGLSFAIGSFDDVPSGARLVRALNVLRDYSPAEAEAARGRGELRPRR